jgi:hypothetical protein
MDLNKKGPKNQFPYNMRKSIAILSFLLISMTSVGQTPIKYFFPWMQSNTNTVIDDLIVQGDTLATDGAIVGQILQKTGPNKWTAVNNSASTFDSITWNIDNGEFHVWINGITTDTINIDGRYVKYGGGQVNTIPYWSDSITLAVSGITWDSYNDRLGVNTTAPEYAMHIIGGLKIVSDISKEESGFIHFDSDSILIGEGGANDRLYLQGATFAIQIGNSLGNDGDVLTSDGEKASWEPGADMFTSVYDKNKDTQIDLDAGGTGRAGWDPYEIVIAVPGAYLDQVNGTGTSGQVLISQGTNQKPIWANVSSVAGFNGISGGTIGYLPYWTTDTTIGNTIVKYDPVNARIGIGVSSPETKLQVDGDVKLGTIAGSGNSIYFGSAAAEVGEGDAAGRLLLKGSSLAINAGMTGYGLAGQVLVSDGTTATWQNVEASGGGTGGTLSGGVTPRIPFWLNDSTLSNTSAQWIISPDRMLYVDGDGQFGTASGDGREINFGSTNVTVGEGSVANRLALKGTSLSVTVDGSPGTAGQVLISNGATATWGTNAPDTTKYYATKYEIKDFLSEEVDGDIANEIQTLSYISATRKLDLSDTATDPTLPLFSTTSPDAGLVNGGAGISNKFLRGDNSWQPLPEETDPTVSALIKGIKDTTRWTAAYNDRIVSMGVTGSTTKTITLNQQDGGTVTADFTDASGASSQNLTSTKSGNRVEVNISDGTGTAFYVSDADSSVTNEIQTITYTPGTRLLDLSGTVTDATLPLFSTVNTDAGLVPGSSSADTSRYLRADGSWSNPPGVSYSEGSGIDITSSTISIDVNSLASSTPDNGESQMIPWYNSLAGTNNKVGLGTISGLPYWNANKLYNYTLSGVAPNNGQVLTFNSGTSTWEAASPIGSKWSDGTGGIYYNSGNVGVGTTSLLAKFNVANSLAGYAASINGGADTWGLTINSGSVAGGRPLHIADNTNTELFSVRGDGLLYAPLYKNNVTGSVERILAVDNSGKIITTSVPGTGVTLFNGRDGVVAPETGDYTASMVTNAAATNSENVFSMDQTITKSSPVINLFNTNPSSTYTALRIRQSDSILYNSAEFGYNKSARELYIYGGTGIPIKFGQGSVETARLTTQKTFELGNITSEPSVRANYGSFYSYNGLPYFKYGSTTYDLSGGGGGSLFTDGGSNTYLTSSDNLLVGSTSSLVTSKLQSYTSTSYGWAGYFYGGGGSNGLQIKAGAASDNYIPFSVQNYSGTNIFTVLASGKMYAHGITNSAKSNVLYYDASTKEITYSAVPSGSGSGDMLSSEWDSNSDGRIDLAKGGTPAYGSGTTTYLRNDGTWGTPAGGSADNWGTQVVSTDATLSGTGVSGSPLKIAQQSATTGQVLKWTGSTWAPGTDAGGLTNPMDAAGEMIIGGASGNPTAIPAPGAAGLVLTSSSTTTAAWAAPSSGFSNPMNTRGDFIYYGASGTTRLGLGDAGETLISNGTDAYWGIPSGSSKWTTDAYGINHQSGNVGIGAASLGNTSLYVTRNASSQYAQRIDNLSDSGNGLEINAGLSSSSYALKVNDYNTDGLFNVRGDGKLIAETYGLLTPLWTGTPIRYLAVESGGGIIEVDAPSGGSSLFTDKGVYTHLTSTTDRLMVGTSSDMGEMLGVTGNMKATGNLTLGSASGSLKNIMFGSTNVMVGEDNASNRLALKGSTMSINVGGTYGSAGQVLTSNGTTATWENNTAAGWKDNGTSVVLVTPTDKVTIGSDTPGPSKFNVEGASYLNGNVTTNNILMRNKLWMDEQTDDITSTGSTQNLLFSSNDKGRLVYLQKISRGSYVYNITPAIQSNIGTGTIEYNYGDGDLINDTLTTNTTYNITKLSDGASGEMLVMQDEPGNRALSLNFYSGAVSAENLLSKIIVGSNVAIDTSSGMYSVIKYRRFGGNVVVEYLHEAGYP